jgi:putative heme-binding domain-containing protein
MLCHICSVLIVSTLSLCLSAVAHGQVSAYAGAEEPATAAEVYGQGVRETAWQSAAAELASFHLPPGFSAQLYAGEPQIAKPLNMAWDTRGRLWVSSTVEYPYPAEEGKSPRDSIKILEDADGDGYAEKTTTFAEELNIPMGLLPVADGAICFSIPYLWHLRDVDGDDRVDERVPLLGPFDTTRDTHGMVNALRRGMDGWIYACHGFNNQSQVTARDGSTVVLHSGNIFRFREDGSRIELVTAGQVNPFGMTHDEWGHWYSADCHSKPLTALLPGACYPSFGRPDDGLGFGPDMMQHLHGSTAICGLLYYQAEHFPLAYRRLFYSGNVMTSRINCNALEWNGTTAIASEQPDFMTSDDPWFRPVDIQLGPDGALYVADFYNKIIGHYEVPLEHPERDRESGRIWRISYTGTSSRDSASLATQSTPDRAEVDLASPNETRRRLAIEALLHAPTQSAETLLEIIRDPDSEEPASISALEILFRRGWLRHDSLEPSTLSVRPKLMVALLRLAAELTRSESHALALRVGEEFPYPNPHVNRAACELLGAAGNASSVHQLVDFMLANPDDPAALHTAKIAVRRLLSNPEILEQTTASWLDQKPAGRTGIAVNSHAARAVAKILPAVDSELAASRLLNYILDQPQSDVQLFQAAIDSSLRYAAEETMERLLQAIAVWAKDDWNLQADYFERTCQAYLSKHQVLTPSMQAFGFDLGNKLETQLTNHLASKGGALDWVDVSGGTWQSEMRDYADGTRSSLISSFTRGENYTGTLSSEPFAAPARLEFWLAGHSGRPNTPARDQNYVQLVLANSGRVLATARVPGSDVANKIEWDLSADQGEPVIVQAIDGDSSKAYAWLAFGSFSLAPLNSEALSPVLDKYLSLVGLGVAKPAASWIDSLPLSKRQIARIVSASLKSNYSQAAVALVEHAIQIGRAELVAVNLLDSPTHSPAQRAELRALAKMLASVNTLAAQTAMATRLMQTATGCQILSELLAQGDIGLGSLKGIQSILPESLDATVRGYLDEQLAAARSMSVATSSGQRIALLDWQQADVALGGELFRQHCVNCHQLAGAGTMVGPQLDGAVKRGFDRLAEDILEPNLNVDQAFRVSSLLLDDDHVVTGLVYEAPDESVRVVGQDGKSQIIPARHIVQRRQSAASLMPGNFGDLLDDRQLASLLTFLSGRHILNQ